MNNNIRVNDGPSWVTEALVPAPEEFLPELASVRAVTTRLHPRPGAPSAQDSSLGGPLLWPQREPWPVCGEPHFFGDVADVPMVPVLQLHQRDVLRFGELDWPAGADLFQLLWCPNDHAGFEWWPRIHGVWRSAQSVGAASAAPSAPADGQFDESMVPAACVLHPEHDVVEYTIRDAPEGFWPPLRERGRAYQELTGFRFGMHVGVAPGTKAGGWPSWRQPPQWPRCAAGHEVRHLLTIQSYELQGDDCQRWAVGTERELIGRFLADRSSVGFEEYEDVTHPHRMQIGRSGGMYLFCCFQCPGAPVSCVADSA